MPHIKSDPIPAVKDPPVKVVVANSLNDAVSTLEKMVCSLQLVS